MTVDSCNGLLSGCHSAHGYEIIQVVCALVCSFSFAEG